MTSLTQNAKYLTQHYKLVPVPLYLVRQLSFTLVGYLCPRVTMEPELQQNLVSKFVLLIIFLKASQLWRSHT